MVQTPSSPVNGSEMMVEGVTVGQSVPSTRSDMSNDGNDRAVYEDAYDGSVPMDDSHEISSPQIVFDKVSDGTDLGATSQQAAESVGTADNATNKLDEHQHQSTSTNATVSASFGLLKRKATAVEDEANASEEDTPSNSHDPKRRAITKSAIKRPPEYRHDSTPENGSPSVDNSAKRKVHFKATDSHFTYEALSEASEENEMEDQDEMARVDSEGYNPDEDIDPPSDEEVIDGEEGQVPGPTTDSEGYNPEEDIDPPTPTPSPLDSDENLSGFNPRGFESDHDAAKVYREPIEPLWSSRSTQASETRTSGTDMDDEMTGLDDNHRRGPVPHRAVSGSPPSLGAYPSPSPYMAFESPYGMRGGDQCSEATPETARPAGHERHLPNTLLDPRKKLHFTPKDGSTATGTTKNYNNVPFRGAKNVFASDDPFVANGTIDSTDEIKDEEDQDQDGHNAPALDPEVATISSSDQTNVLADPIDQIIQTMRNAGQPWSGVVEAVNQELAAQGLPADATVDSVYSRLTVARLQRGGKKKGLDGRALDLTFLTDGFGKGKGKGKGKGRATGVEFSSHELEVLGAVVEEVRSRFWDMVAAEVIDRTGGEFSAEDCEGRFCGL